MKSKSLGKSLPEILKEQESQRVDKIINDLKIVDTSYKSTPNGDMVNHSILTPMELPFKFITDKDGEVIAVTEFNPADFEKYWNAKPFSCIPYISNELKAINKRNEGCF